MGPMCTLPFFRFRVKPESRHFLGHSPSRELLRARDGHLSGLGSDLDATSQHPCGLGQPRTVIRNHSACLLPARARRAPGRQRQADLTHGKAKCPWKGYVCTPPPVPASTRSLALSVSRFHSSQICPQPTRQHRPPWQSLVASAPLPAAWHWAHVRGVVGGPVHPDCRHSPSAPLLWCGVTAWGESEGKLTFSAKTGLPESSVRCKNSKCRDPNSARMLLLPEVAQPQLPLKRHQRRHPAGSLAEMSSGYSTG